MAVAMACNSRQRLSEVNPSGVKYFMEKLLFQIYEHFDEQQLTDVSFKLSNPTALVTAHRLILSAASPYFRELFKSDKGICPLIEITDIDSDTFERLIAFCYTGKTLITIENVDQMLKAALALQLEDAVINCVEFLIEHITDYTLQRAYTLESETQCAILNEKILEYEIRNFMWIIQSAEFLNFDAKKLQKILESDDLNVLCEKDVFDAVKRWYEHDASVRKEQLPDLIACLRLTQLDTNFLLTHIQPLPGCEFVVLKALSWVNIPLTRGTISLRFTNPRAGRSDYLVDTIFFALYISNGVGGSKSIFQGGDGESRTIFQYNQTEDSWQKWVDLKTDMSDFRVIFLDDNLIFIGGNRGGKELSEVRSWNFKTKTFKQLPSMNHQRDKHSVVILNDKIYAIGGEQSFGGMFGMNSKILQSVEMFSVSDGWKLIASMNTPRSSSAAVSLNGKIYVMGGSDAQYGTRTLKSVECYDPTTKCWIPCADMNEAHSSPGATVHNGQIFVVGGWDGKHFKTVERYNPQRNEWTMICSLSIGRGRIGCISINNQLWAVGGSDLGYKDCVSVYDGLHDKWIDKNPIPLAGDYYCFTVPKTLLQKDPSTIFGASFGPTNVFSFAERPSFQNRKL